MGLKVVSDNLADFWYDLLRESLERVRMQNQRYDDDWFKGKGVFHFTAIAIGRAHLGVYSRRSDES
jgi:hypothetical protein